MVMNYSWSSLLRNGLILSTTLTFSAWAESLRGVSGCDYFFINYIMNRNSPNYLPVFFPAYNHARNIIY